MQVDARQNCEAALVKGNELVNLDTIHQAACGIALWL